MGIGMTLSCEPETTADAHVSASFDERVRMVRALCDRMQMDYGHLKREYDEQAAALRNLRLRFAELSREYDRLSDECERMRGAA